MPDNQYKRPNQPDVLEVIANLSNNEVFTPPRVVMPPTLVIIHPVMSPTESPGARASTGKKGAGTPVKTVKRPIIDDSYSVALTIVCADLAGHDAYQVDPLHLAFVERFKTFWIRVQIYDAE